MFDSNFTQFFLAGNSQRNYSVGEQIYTGCKTFCAVPLRYAARRKETGDTACPRVSLAPKGARFTHGYALAAAMRLILLNGYFSTTHSPY